MAESPVGTTTNHTPIAKAVRGTVPLLCWMLGLLTIFQIPIAIRQLGFQPPDDANRHVAKAISGKPWSEILVMRPEITIDTNAGWHAILRGLHLSLGWDADALMTFSIVGLAAAFMLSGLLSVRRPEAWVAALLIAGIANPEFHFRTMMGRPLLTSQAVVVLILALWTRPGFGLAALSRPIATTVLIGFAVWIHGSWYLFVLPVAAFGLARAWRAAGGLAACWAVGTLFGALLTGQPLEFLGQHLRWAVDAFGHHDVTRALVMEFRPSGGELPTVMSVALVAILRVRSRRSNSTLARDPAFLLAVLGWVLGLRVARFWLDWGRPAAIVWIASALDDILGSIQPARAIARLAACAGVCTALYLSMTADFMGRWTENLSIEYLSADDKELAPWLPEEDGILYTADMRDFFHTFFANPTAPWRYVLGFEPTIMLPEDLRTYQSIRWNKYAPEAYRPWIMKMRPRDRVMMPGDPWVPDRFSELEWHHARGKWIGRLPRGGP